MNRLAATVLGLVLLTACAEGSTGTAGGAEAPQVTLAQAQESLCGHIINDLAPSFESAPVPFDEKAATAWAELRVLFESDAVMFQQAGEEPMASKLRELAKAADAMRTAIDQPGEPTSTGLVEGMDAVATATQGVADKVRVVVHALGEDVCVPHDRNAQAALRNALAAAKTYFTDGSTYVGYDPEAARAIEPSITFVGDEPAAEEVVSINFVDGDQVVMSTLSGSGRAFCIADSLTDGVVYGALDAHGATSATGCGSGTDW